MKSRRAGTIFRLFLAAAALWVPRLWAQAEPPPGREETKPSLVQLQPDPETARARAAIEQGLKFLAESQLDSGAIGARYKTAVTSLSGLAILGAGHRYRGEGPYPAALRGALNSLLSGGSAGNGYLSDPESRMHGHCYAVLFLTQLYGELPPEVQPKVERLIRDGLEVIRKSQTDRGGWYYAPDNPPYGPDEASITICALQALRAANGIGFLVPKSTVDRAATYVRDCQAGDGSFRYSIRGGDLHTSFALTVAAVSTLQAIGVYDDPHILRGLDFARRCVGDHPTEPIKAAEREFFSYANLYAAQAFYQVGGDLWASWYPAARRYLLGRQLRDGSWKDDYGAEFGTAVALLILELPLNYLPIFQR